MNKFKKFFTKMLAVISEYITLIVTIIASTYIIISSQFIEYSTITLLLWIISLLGLIALAISAEKFFKLKNIESCVEEIKKKTNEKVKSIDDVFFSRKALAPLEDRLAKSKKIVIIGGSLARLSDEYYAFFEGLLNRGVELEIIMVKPYSKAAEHLLKNTVYESKDIDLYNNKINESLNRFKKLQQVDSSILTIRLLETTPPCSLIYSKGNDGDSFVQVELYLYAVPTRDRLEFKVNESDKETFKYFMNQIEYVRKLSKIN